MRAPRLGAFTTNTVVLGGFDPRILATQAARNSPQHPNEQKDGPIMDAKGERDRLLEYLYNLVYLIEQTRDPAKIAEYADVLNKVEAKIIALGPPPLPK